MGDSNIDSRIQFLPLKEPMFASISLIDVTAYGVICPMGIGQSAAFEDASPTREVL